MDWCSYALWLGLCGLGMWALPSCKAIPNQDKEDCLWGHLETKSRPWQKASPMICMKSLATCTASAMHHGPGTCTWWTSWQRKLTSSNIAWIRCCSMRRTRRASFWCLPSCTWMTSWWPTGRTTRLKRSQSCSSGAARLCWMRRPLSHSGERRLSCTRRMSSTRSRWHRPTSLMRCPLESYLVEDFKVKRFWTQLSGRTIAAVQDLYNGSAVRLDRMLEQQFLSAIVEVKLDLLSWRCSMSASTWRRPRRI